MILFFSYHANGTKTAASNNYKEINKNKCIVQWSDSNSKPNSAERSL